MLREDFQSVFSSILCDKVIDDFVAEFELKMRERAIDISLFIRSMVGAAAEGHGGRQAAVLRFYLQNGGEHVGRSGFYRRFDHRLENVMKALSDNAMQAARLQPIDLPGFPTKYVVDWHIFDSTTVKVDDELIDVYPGAGDYAAIKLHKRMSLGQSTVIDYHFSPAREHDSQHLFIDEGMRGLGILIDLGYASIDTIEKCQKHGVEYVMRLKDGWKPQVKEIHRGTIVKPLKLKTSFDMVINENLILDGKLVDLSVVLGKNNKQVTARIVGVPCPDKSYRFYITSLPRDIGPRQVCDLYRSRWEIETDNRLNKSCFNLDEIGSKTVPALHAMIHAAMTGTVICCLLAHRHRLANRPPVDGPRVARDHAPLHPQLLSRALAVAAERVAHALTLSGAEAEAAWSRITEYLVFLGRDPNWRRRPSVLDILRGWKKRPVRKRSSSKSK